jgi:hypothetical protein
MDNKTTNPYNVRIGETWGENDPRRVGNNRRIVEVIVFTQDGRRAKIRSLKTS